ncbi:MAG: hypothetical protein JW836_11175 [Deltaproteobacteria bacterium]|nr:hypothetical protein [Deltaproteobacteria bacterium]
MSRDRRLQLIESIENERKSKVVAYVISDRPGSEGSLSPDGVEEMYRLLCELKPLDRKPMDLFLFAHRGDITVPWQMVGMIREIFDLFNVIVPHKAHGPATMIALGADTIVMGERGTLSSIQIPASGDSLGETQNVGIKSHSVEDAKAVMSLMEYFGRMREKQKIEAFFRVMEATNPFLLGSINKQIEHMRADCLGLLEKRKRRFSKGKNKRIVDRLFSDFSSPYHSITRSEAVEGIGLKQVKKEENLEPLFGELLMLYKQELETNEHVHLESAPDSFEEEEKVFPNRKIACMESTKKMRVLIEDLKVQKIREVPPSIRLDPQINLPTLEITSELREGDIWSFIEGWLQGNLPGLIEESFLRFKKSLPVTACKRTPFNRRWVDS